MLSSIRRKVLCWSAAALVGLGGVVGRADAVIFIGNWDPLFNINFDADFAWKGSATVDVDGSCLALANGDYAVPGSCPAASLIGVSLAFYDNDNDSPAGTLVFGPAFPAIATVRIAGGALAGIATAAPLTSTGFTNSLFTGTWDLELDFTLAEPVLTLSRTTGCEFEECFFESYSSNGPGGGGVRNFTWRVPEPSTLLLLGVALAGLGFSSRRRT